MSGDLWLLGPMRSQKSLSHLSSALTSLILGLPLGSLRSSYTVGESFQGRLKEQCPWRPEYNPQTGYLPKAYLRVAAKTQ